MSFKSQEFSIEDASNHKMNLPTELKGFKEAANELRCNMVDASVKMACEMTDSAILRTRAHSA